MAKICPKNIVPIDKSECIGNSRVKFNANFNTLKDAICTATSSISSITKELDFLPPVGTIIRFWGDMSVPGINFDALGRGKAFASNNQNLFPWALCNGNNGTPDLRDRFIVGAGGEYTQNFPAGTRGPVFNSTASLAFSSVSLTIPELPIHNHTIIDGNYNGVPNSGHTHSINDPQHDHEYSDIWDSKGGSAMNDDCLAIITVISGIPPILMPFPQCIMNKTRHAGLNQASKTRKTGDPEGSMNDSKLPPTTELSYTGVKSLFTGQSLPHENRPPYNALGFIMRIQ